MMEEKQVKRIVIYGCGDMGIQTYNILKHDKSYKVAGFLDDNTEKRGALFLGYPVFGDHSALPELHRDQNIEYGIATIGDNRIRSGKIRLMRKAGLQIATAIHPQAFIDSPESIGEGTVVEMGAFVHPETVIGEGCFVCCGAVVAHNSSVGDYVLLAGGCIFGSRVVIGDYTLVGVGANISPYVTIGKNVLIGTGAAVVKDLPDNVVAAGVPAKILRENK